MICPNCKKELQNGARFCGWCGAQVSEIPDSKTKEPSPVENTEMTLEKSEKKEPDIKKTKRLFPVLIIIAMVIALAVILVVTFGFQNQSGQSDDSELEALLDDVAQDTYDETETEVDSSENITIKVRGTYGDLKWTLDSAGTLTISPIQGSCEMDDFYVTGPSYSFNSKAPWSSYADSVTSVVIESGITGIGSSAFYDFVNMTSITIPDTVQYINYFAFRRCISLVSIDIPASVTEINEKAIVGCASLQTVNVSDENEYYISVDGVLFTSDMSTLILYPHAKSGASYTVPDGVQYIVSEAFSVQGMENDILESVVLPEGLIEIGENAFYGCEMLKSVVIADAETIGSKAFYSCDLLESVEITGTVEEVGDSAFLGCDSLTEITFPEGLIKIRDSAFAECSSLTSVTLPASLEKIGEGAFSSSGLTDVYYAGSQSQWNSISLGGGDTKLAFAQIHYNN